MEGVPPAMIENTAKMAGMPGGPLSCPTRLRSIWCQDHEGDRSDLGANAIDQTQKKLLVRDGRKTGRFRPQERQGLLRLSRKRAKAESLWSELAACSPSTSTPTRSTLRN